jgi:hypothetical protein
VSRREYLSTWAEGPNVCAIVHVLMVANKLRSSGI